MLSTIATFLISKGIAPKLAKPLIITAGVALLITVLSVGKCAYDRSVVEKHDAKVTAKIATAARSASETATAKAEDRATVEVIRVIEIKKDVDHAKQDPAAQSLAGPASRAFLERLRQQQSAGGEAAD